MISAFLFDIGNVLLRFDFGLALARLAPDCDRLDAVNDSAAMDLKHRYESGEIGRAEFLRGAMQVVGYRGTEAQFARIWQEIFTENLPMTTLVPQIASRYPSYLLSNTSDLHLDYIRAEYPVFRFLPEGVYSHEAQAMKPGQDIYQTAIAQLGLVPEQTVFIDDMEENIVTALELGFQALHYDFRNHDRFLQQLAELGVELESPATRGCKI